MKKLLFLLLSLICFELPGFSQIISSDSIDHIFRELQINTRRYKYLWNLNLYGPVLLVEPATRKLYSNFPDSAGVLKKDGKIFTGILPEKINIANTSLAWNGLTWAMIMLPLPVDRKERLDLLSHELFHRSQPQLGFHIMNSDNNHLDKKYGRVYLRLELEALRKALIAPTNSESADHLKNAFFFRSARYSAFPGSEKSENILELNEGLAAYTGTLISARNDQEIKDYFERKITEFTGSPTFVRSFAYITTPLYGFLLRQKIKEWNRSVTDSTNLTAYFIKSFGLQVPANLCHDCISLYNAETIISEEIVREKENEMRIAAYKKVFIEQSHLEIRLEQMNISFDPRNIVPLEGYGTVYPSMRISDNWGILTVTGGALLGSEWDRVVVSEPVNITPEKIAGNGWVLELNAKYSIEKTGDNYILRKK